MIDGVALGKLRRARKLTQQALAERAGCSVDTIRRLEQGQRNSAQLTTLDAIAAALQAPTAAILRSPPQGGGGQIRTAAIGTAQGVIEVQRRDLLNLITTSGAAMMLHHVAGDVADADPARLTQIGALQQAGRDLWKDFLTTQPKAAVWPDVHRHIRRLTAAAQRPQPENLATSIYTMLADAYQLAGEIMFDLTRPGDAEQCYALAASAAREAKAFDLWACALIRHAYVGMYEQRSRDVVPMLELAVRLARHGDPGLSTRHWAAAVLAQARAHTGDQLGCERALELAEHVTDLNGSHNLGWLRFDGSRLTEDRAACYVAQQRADLAEPILLQMLAQSQTVRRRGLTQIDLATVGTITKDPLTVVTYGFAALEHARTADSGVLIGKLHNLRPRLSHLRKDRYVRHLDTEIAALAPARAVPS